MNTQLGGYAEYNNGQVTIRGGYNTATIPMDELDALVQEFNKEVWNPDENPYVGNITLRQITGSYGPSSEFVSFYLKKNE